MIKDSNSGRSADSRTLKILNPLCEYAQNPLGIDVLKPRFSWMAECGERGVKQQAYRIIVSGSRENAASDIGDMWDSGKITSGCSVNIEYGGKELISRGIYFWKVYIWTEEYGLSESSEISHFEMGLLNKKDWVGIWMGFHGAQCGKSILFRNEFKLKYRPVKARAYISGVGYNEFRLNGSKVGDNVLDPGCTEYNKRVFYVTHDVTEYLNIGDNVIGVIMGNGWYAATALLFQLEIYAEDGEKTVIYTNTNFTEWQIASGPILENSIYDGEIYDAREEKSGWEVPGYIENMDKKKYFETWTAPCAIHGPAGQLTAQMLEPIKVMGDIKPVSVKKVRENIYVYDMGQNFAGWARLKVTGPEGSKVTMRFAETLYDDGAVNQENLRTARARDIYILKGAGEEIYEPRFTYHGFRYVQVEDFPGVPTLDSITGRIVRSSMDITGSFSCSNELINRLHSNVVWTEVSNLHSIPTDCPQRNERQGWLNDATVRGEETVYNFNMSRFFPKWINDISDTQDRETGAITDTAPFGWGWRPADPVCSSYINIPWLLYLNYGDKRTLEEHYEGFKEWTRCLGDMARDYIIEYTTFGDWASPAGESVTESLGEGAVSATTPGSLMSTGYYYYNAKLIAEIARIIGRNEDVEVYEQLAEKIKNAFNQKFFDNKTINYATGSQSSNVFPLYLNLVPEGYRERILENVVRDIEKRNYHLSTGNLCTKYILEILAEEGYADMAYKLVTQTTYPSWGYMISMGATTIWERWEYATGGSMNSHNHPMYGTVGCWFYKYLGGIRAEQEAPGFGSLTIKPVIIPDLEHVNCKLKTVKGDVESSWSKESGNLNFKITIPFNSTANVFLPIPDIQSDSIYLIEGNTVIWENNNTTANTKGVSKITQDDKYLKFKLGSGSYNFTLKK